MYKMWINIIVAGFLLYESILDITTRKISVLISLILLGGGLIYNLVFQVNMKHWIYGIVFSIFICGFSYISKGQLGLGDGIVLFALSPLIGQRVISIFMSALFLCGVTGVIMSLCKGISRKDRLPLVPFMMLGFLLENLA